MQQQTPMAPTSDVGAGSGGGAAAPAGSTGASTFSAGAATAGLSIFQTLLADRLARQREARQRQFQAQRDAQALQERAINQQIQARDPAGERSALNSMIGAFARALT